MDRAFILFVLLAALGAGACDAGRVARQESPAGDDGRSITVELRREHAAAGPRYLRGARSAVTLIEKVIGPVKGDIRLVDASWRGDETPAEPPSIQLLPTPWWSAANAMAAELASARAVAGRFWRMQARTTPDWFAGGLVEYTARRAVEPLFQVQNQPPGYTFDEERHFGRFVPWFVRIRLLRETDGEPLSAYRARPGADPRTHTGLSADDERSLTAKTALALASLERWLGQAVFDQVLAEFVRDGEADSVTPSLLAAVASRTTGTDLSWFFAPIFESTIQCDYAVASLTSVADGGAGKFRTTVVVRRLGDLQFTGRSAAPVAGFESGRGVGLAVDFADGARVTDAWDGRAPSKTFEYASGAPAVSAVVDPDAVILLDYQRVNNSITLDPRAQGSAGRWAARWFMWLENALLTYAFLA